MTATFYFHVGDGELRAEDANPNVRIIAGNFDWTILLENRLDCARWMKAIADADALFIKRKAAGEAHDVIVPPSDVSYEPHPCDCGSYVCTRHAPAAEDGLEPLPPLPQRPPAGPPDADLNDPYAGEEEPSRAERWGISEQDLQEAERADDLPQRPPAGPPGPGDLEADERLDHVLEPDPVPPWQATMRAELSETALAGETPLESLAAEPQEDEAQA